jgi:hypothetical protein
MLSDSVDRTTITPFGAQLPALRVADGRSDLRVNAGKVEQDRSANFKTEACRGLLDYHDDGFAPEADASSPARIAKVACDR